MSSWHRFVQSAQGRHSRQQEIIFQKWNRPYHRFEVETTTSWYSLWIHFFKSMSALIDSFLLLLLALACLDKLVKKGYPNSYIVLCQCCEIALSENYVKYKRWDIIDLLILKKRRQPKHPTISSVNDRNLLVIVIKTVSTTQNRIVPVVSIICRLRLHAATLQYDGCLTARQRMESRCL